MADDDVPLRRAVAHLLARCGFEVVGEAGDGARLLELVREHGPDLVIVDTRMPPDFRMEGLEAARTIRERFPSVAILVLSAHVDLDHAVNLLSSGDRIGYLLKSRVSDITEFVDTLEQITMGSSVIDPSLVRELVAAHHHEEPLAGLTPPERDVFALAAQGRSNADIAQKLAASEATVETHIRSILTKLCLPEADASHRRALAILAFLDTR